MFKARNTLLKLVGTSPRRVGSVPRSDGAMATIPARVPGVLNLTHVHQIVYSLELRLG